MANSQKQAEPLLDVMRDAAGRCSLEMKSKCMIFTYRGAPIKLLKGMEVVEQLRFLGVTVVNKRNCFLQHKKGKIMQARKMANLTYCIIARSCSKILIGKTYFKSCFARLIICIIGPYMDMEGDRQAAAN